METFCSFCRLIDNSEGWITWAKRVFSQWYTFVCYRASQSRGSTRWLPFTTCVKPIVKRIVISVYLNSVCYLISYTTLFTKLNLFEILHLFQQNFRSMIRICYQSVVMHWNLSVQQKINHLKGSSHDGDVCCVNYNWLKYWLTQSITTIAVEMM